MEMYLLKSAACLAVFYAFYKGLLENQSMHRFKRVYLLITLIAAFIIPWITFTVYTEAAPLELTGGLTYVYNSDSITETAVNYWPWILIGIYSMGVLFFGYRFVRNLGDMIFKIKSNPKRYSGRLTNVLLNEQIIPHTFFNYIFFNRKNYEAGEIPEEVILHEETHAVEKHSLDVLLVELLQVVFWFNPLIYLMKHAIKLNHEFLADRAVLDQGADAVQYQHTLLEFSSAPACNPMAHAINYSFIKKRFQIMKTQTSSRRTQWVKGLLVIPVLLALIYSFSSTEEVLIDPENAQFSKKELRETNHPDFGDFQKWQDPNNYNLYMDGKAISNSEILEYHPDDIPFHKEFSSKNHEVRTVVLMSNSYWQHELGLGFVSPENQQAIIVESLQERDLSIVISKNSITVNGEKTGLKGFAKTVDKVTQNWTQAEKEDFNIEVSLKDVDESMIDKVNEAYKKSKLYKANPDRHALIPPPPPPPPAPEGVTVIEIIETGDENDNEEIEVIEIKGGTKVVRAYDEDENEILIERIEGSDSDEEIEVIVVKENGKTIKKKVKGNTVIEIDEEGNIKKGKGYKIKKAPKGQKVKVIEIEDVNAPPPPPPPAPDGNIPPPPPPPDLEEDMKRLSDEGASFYFNGESIDYNRAKKLLKEENITTIDVIKRDGTAPKVEIHSHKEHPDHKKKHKKHKKKEKHED